MHVLLEPFASLEDYDRWAWQQPEGECYEVVDGLPVMSPAPGGPHQLALINVAFLLRASCPADYRLLPAPWDWVLRESPRLFIRQPDLVVVRRDEVGDRLFHVPLLAVEVLSPSSVERDAVTKRREYAHAGLEHYWLVDPDTPQVAIFRRRGDDLELVTHAVGDTEVKVAEPCAVTFRPSDLLD